MAEPKQQYPISVQDLNYVGDILKKPPYRKLPENWTPGDFQKEMFSFASKYEDWTDKLIRAKENIVQGVGLPGALLGAYALGNKPKNGKSRLPGVAGAIGGAYLGKTLYDFAATNKNTKQYIDDFTKYVDKHTDGVGGQYVPMAAQALGGLLGYGLLKQSNNNMYKQAASSTKVPWWKLALAGGAGAAGTGSAIGVYNEYQDLKDKALTSIDNVNNALKKHQNMTDQISTTTIPTLNDTINEYGELAKNSQETLEEVNKNVNDKMPTVLTLGGVGIGLGIGVPLATYLINKRNKSKKKNKSKINN